MKPRKKCIRICLLGLFITATTISVLSLSFKSELSDLDDFILERLPTNHVPGLSACIVIKDKLVWAKGFGWADVEKKIPMSADTIQNIGSISKTVTATAIMQLWEKGRFKLDDDVNEQLPFQVRNPNFPDVPITYRQLLTHKSSIKDGPAYGESYACGDPKISLKDWIQGYLKPQGKYFNKEENFHIWKPGTEEPQKGPRAYTNVGFGLLGYLVEVISGEDFAGYCKKHIFEPLGMTHTGWMLADIDVNNHAVPYTYISEDSKMPEELTFESFLPRYGADKQSITRGELFPHCLYSFPNYPDGLIRTSVNELSRFLRVYLNEGTFEGKQVLKKETVQSMLSENHYGRGLCWYPMMRKNDEIVWGHGGGDPGIATQMQFLQKDGLGVIIFFNCDNPGKAYGEIIKRLFEEAANLIEEASSPPSGF
ncbi:MAG: serine hydrolase [Candidatus Aminicenantes bacterium]|nr:serine hydrolase [Candidatus Aminicenantes bacterium]